MTELRLGIIGAGRIAGRFLREASYVEDVRVTAIYNRHIERAEALAEASLENAKGSAGAKVSNQEVTPKTSEILCTDDIREIYRTCDAVYIAINHEAHFEYAKDALEHGMHVLCEKPMTLSKREAEDLFALAKARGLILMEALKTAYMPGFQEGMDNAQAGRIGRVIDVEAAFSKLLQDPNSRELQGEIGGSFTELASYALLPIAKLLGHHPLDIQYISYVDERGIDLYTKALFTYEHATATVKVGLGAKTEGNLVLAGTDGYLLAESPWWYGREYQLCYEDRSRNEKHEVACEGDGLRYEIRAFAQRVASGNVASERTSERKEAQRPTEAWTEEDSIFLAEMMEEYLAARREGRIRRI